MKKVIFLFSMFIVVTLNAQYWNVTGNSGTTPSTNFIGTTDNQSLVFKVNNTEKIRITPTGRLVIQGLDGTVGWSNNFFLGGGNDLVTGLGNYSFGIGSMVSITTGGSNTSIGANSLKNITSGNANSAVGANSQFNNMLGSNNSSLGLNSLYGPGIVNDNTAIGNAALARYNAVATDNISSNTAVGLGVLAGLLNGNGNTGLGKRALNGLVNGNDNIAIGLFTANNLLNGNNNIYIGQNLIATNSTISNELNIGNWIVGNNGTIGIGTFTTPLPANGIAPDGEKYKLFVKDGIRTEKVKVDIAANNGWADYVFAKDYKLMPLKDLGNFIKENGHLPEVPTTEQAIENGIELKEMNILLLKKIEELTLYTLEQNKKIENLEIENKKLQDFSKRLEALETQIKLIK